jgi:EAL domain-containing protein (putative c-di-GMP-specific phosphodiesterase class I)/PAS domain-containing protein
MTSLPVAGDAKTRKSVTQFPVPENETIRLEALRDLMILDTPPEADLDALVRLACDIFNVPIGIVSLVDRDRQWFKAAVGLDIPETERAVAICNFTISTGQPFIVNDASRDPRFQSNPLVTGAPDIRFYAGVPLALAPGVNIGTLCIIDRQAGEIDNDGLRRLRLLGEMAVALLRAHRATIEVARRSQEISRQAKLITEQAATLNQQKNILARASSLAKLGAWQIDVASGRVSWSEGMYALHDVDRSYDVQLHKIVEFYPQPDRDRLLGAMEKSQRENSAYHFEGRMFTAKGRLCWVRVIGDVEVKDGKPVHRFGLWQDITNEKAMVDQINELARRDELTGLLNRKALNRNLSASQFRDPKLAADLLRAMDLHGVDRTMIEVEVTENVFLSASSSSVLRACHSFKAGGIQIAFDDFGTGFASLSHLRDFPVDTIKIDRSFISKLGRGENTTAIVNAMVSLAHNLSMKIVAEGVEAEAQAEFLGAIGCDQAQGYLFGRPEPASVAVRHLMKRETRTETGVSGSQAAF